jgi:hypothetical protein
MRKRLYDNQIALLTASSEHAEYPASSALTPYPQDIYKAETNSTTVSAYCYGGISAVYLQTNASEVIVSAEDPMATRWGTGSQWGYTLVTGTNLASLSGSGWSVEDFIEMTSDLEMLPGLSFSGLNSLYEGIPILLLFDGTVTSEIGDLLAEAVVMDSIGSYVRYITNFSVVRTVCALADVADVVKIYELEATARWANVEIDDTHTIVSGNGNGVAINFAGISRFSTKINIYLATNTDDFVTVGILWGGQEITTSQNPNWGISRYLDDSSSTYIRLSDNGRYYKHRNTQGVWSVIGQLPDAEARLLEQDIETYGQSPVAVQLTDLDSGEWVLFGAVNEFRRTYAFPGWSDISYTFTEEK